jgi:hypothetical protein
MTMFRNQLMHQYGDHSDEAFVVGCALDRVQGPVFEDDIDAAMGFFRQHKDAWKKEELPINARRDLVAQFIGSRR